jgi:hypothetical protein
MAVLFTLSRQNLTLSPPLLGEKFHLFLADLGQITSKCLIYDMCQNMSNNKNSNLMTLDAVSRCRESHLPYLTGSPILRSWPGIQLKLCKIQIFSLIFH